MHYMSEVYIMDVNEIIVIVMYFSLKILDNILISHDCYLSRLHGEYVMCAILLPNELSWRTLFI